VVLTLKEFLRLIEEIAPARFAEPWDNCGLQIGEYSQQIKRVFGTLDPTLDALKSACSRKAQLLFTHHPLIFEPISSLNSGRYPGNVILEAARCGISVVAAHTNLDVCPGGINDILAELFQLRNVEVLKEMAGEAGVGLGRIGEWSRPVELAVVVANVKKILGIESVKVTGEKNRPIRRVAICGGSGGSLVSVAAEKGADLLLTGDVGYHHAMGARAGGIALIDAGHFPTERTAFAVFTERLGKMVTERGWEVSFEVDEEQGDPSNIQ